jgi:hypothetical protein
MAKRVPTFFPQRVNQRVPLKAYTGGIEGPGLVTVELGAPLALANQGILAAQSVAAAGNTSTFAATFVQSEAQMGRFGRCVRVVLSGAGTGNLIIRGRDFLGQRMQETIALNGATPVLGIKAFRFIDNIEWPTVAAVTLDVGWRDCFGLPHKFVAIDLEEKSEALAANAGTFVAGLATGTAATATNADVRGTYLPVTVIPNGTIPFRLRYFADFNNLDGNAQFIS